MKANAVEVTEQGNGAAEEHEAEASQSGERTVADMLAELEQTRQEAAELLDSLQRARAEMVNYRRRMEQEQERLRQRATERLLLKLLPIADDFDRALRSMPQELQSNAWIEGIRLIERKLWAALEGEGVSLMNAVGTPFDPSLHEAVTLDDSGTVDTVVEEFQRGYLLNGSVLRPAMVKVGTLDKLPKADA
ncbi:MAG: nucleotide exchange factor GrpE [Chloroflexi bacterium]|nr:MAG: nucleotide exchange factor GrpE [Chloroflexota bacterium]